MGGKTEVYLSGQVPPGQHATATRSLHGKFPRSGLMSIWCLGIPLPLHSDMYSVFWVHLVSLEQSIRWKCSSVVVSPGWSTPDPSFPA